MWPNNSLSELLGIDLPIIQASMVSAWGSALAAAALGREIGAADFNTDPRGRGVGLSRVSLSGKS